MTPPMRIALTGPTASGKTDVAVEIARLANGHVISVDSRQCYRGMEIGTAAPDAEQQALAPHLNVGLLDPRSPDTVAAFTKRESAWKEEIAAAGRRVVYCGGGTLYTQALLHPLDPMPPADSGNVERLQRESEADGLGALYERLKAVDPDYASRMDGMNRLRIIRALDVWMQTGRPFSSFHRSEPVTPPPDMILFGIRHRRHVLHERIRLRTERLFTSSFEQEAGRLDLLLRGGRAGSPVGKESPPLLRTLAYPEMIELSAGRMERKEAVHRATIATRQYARRQSTWFQRWPFIHWLEPAPDQTPLQLAETVLESVAAMEKNPYF